MIHSFFSRLLLAVALNMLAFGIANSAYMATYTYTGNVFGSIIHSIYGDIEYPNISNLKISFSIDESLIPKSDHFESSIIDLTNMRSPIIKSLSISDGNRSMDGEKIYFYRNFKSYNISFDTDPYGNIGNSWHVSGWFGDYGPNHSSSTTFESIFDPTTGRQYDRSEYIWNLIITGEHESILAETINKPGTWTRTLTYYDPPQDVPIPGAMALYFSALFGISLRDLLKNRAFPAATHYVPTR